MGTKQSSKGCGSPQNNTVLNSIAENASKCGFTARVDLVSQLNAIFSFIFEPYWILKGTRCLFFVVQCPPILLWDELSVFKWYLLSILLQYDNVTHIHELDLRKPIVFRFKVLQWRNLIVPISSARSSGIASASLGLMHVSREGVS